MTMQEEQNWAPLANVAAAYGVSIDTIRRRMKRGELDARREQTPQGFRWLAPLPAVAARNTAPDAPGSPQAHESAPYALDIAQRAQEELIETLRHELAIRNREISRLHDVIASQAQALQLAAGSPTGPGEPMPASSEPAPSEPIATDAATPATIEAQPAGVWARFCRWVTGAPVSLF